MEAAKLYKYLPAGITWLIERLPPDIQGHINEIRLRRNGVLSVSLPEQNLVIQSGKGAYICTDRDIDETVAYISRSSMYAFDGAVRNGYIPLPDGGRAGICGDAVCENGAIRTFGSISSVCLRVSRLVKGYASDLASYFASHGLVGALVFAPPGAGKTTYLKSAISLLSENRRVAVADETVRAVVCFALYGGHMLRLPQSSSDRTADAHDVASDHCMRRDIIGGSACRAGGSKQRLHSHRIVPRQRYKADHAKGFCETDG